MNAQKSNFSNRLLKLENRLAEIHSPCWGIYRDQLINAGIAELLSMTGGVNHPTQHALELLKEYRKAEYEFAKPTEL